MKSKIATAFLLCIFTTQILHPSSSPESSDSPRSSQFSPTKALSTFEQLLYAQGEINELSRKLAEAQKQAYISELFVVHVTRDHTEAIQRKDARIAALEAQLATATQR